MSRTNDRGLRLMIFDKTDVRQTWKPDLNKDGSPDLELALNLGLSHSWFAGGALYKALRTLDDCEGFDSWKDALLWIMDTAPSRPIEQIQYWGHGSPGAVWMKDQALTQASPNTASEVGELLRKIAVRLSPASLIWFRTCSTFAGTRGHEFAKTWGAEMGCRVAGYTHIIGPWQSGLHSLMPGMEPEWSDTEGIERGTADRPEQMRWSSPFLPNTINCLRSSVPKGW